MKRWLWFLALSGALAAAYLYKPVLPSACTLKVVAGVGCPGCGMTRSVVAAAHLRLADAVRFHVFGPLVLAVTVALWVLALFGKTIPLEHRGVHLALVAFAVLLLLYWAYRLTQGTVP